MHLFPVLCLVLSVLAASAATLHRADPPLTACGAVQDWPRGTSGVIVLIAPPPDADGTAPGRTAIHPRAPAPDTGVADGPRPCSSRPG